MPQSSDKLHSDAREIFRTIQMLKERMIRCFESMPRDREGAAAVPEITFPQHNAMTALQEMGEVSIKQLAARLDVSPPSASVMVDRLVDLGLVTREQSKQDRRAVGVCLSPEGAAVLAAMEAEMLRNIEALMEKLGGETTAKWCDVYAQIRAVIEAEHREAASGGSESKAV